MFPRRLRLLCLRGLALLSIASPFANALNIQGSMAKSAPVLVLDGLGKGIVPLDGLWQFHLGDDLAWADPAFDDSHWEQLTADKPWGSQGHPNNGGFGWYRLHISVTLAPGASPNLALFVPFVEGAYEVYWNGSLVGRVGKLPPHARPSFQLGQTFGLGQVLSGVLAVRFWRPPPLTNATKEGGGFTIPPSLGSPDAIARGKASLDYDWLRSQQFSFGLNSLYALAALLSFLAWLRDRRQSLLFWMSAFCLAQPLIQLADGWLMPMSDITDASFTLPLLGIRDVSLWFVLLLLLRLDEKPALVRRTRRLACLQVALTVSDTLVCVRLLTGSTNRVVPLQVADYILTFGFSLLGAFPLVLVAYAVVRRRRLDPARWTVAALAFTMEMIAVIRLTAAQGLDYTHVTFYKELYGPLFTVLGNPIDAVTLIGTLLLVAIIYAVFRYSFQEHRRQITLEQEFKSARDLQQSLIPAVLPTVPGFTLTSAYRPASEVGGDFFQIIPVEGSTTGSTLILLGDVSGKGLKAAMTVSLIVGAARTLAEFTSRPSELLSGLNRKLCGHLHGGFATCIALRVDYDGTCVMASAGHPAPFLNDHELTIAGAFPLGLFLEVDYEESPLELEGGDHLALYTDGLLEARSASGELYSFGRLQSLFARRPSAAEAAEAAVAFGQDDDITVLTLTWPGLCKQPKRRETSAMEAPP
jgi:hypothetical protein